ncbi:cathepsin D isoform X2 [Halyomorpha halys]|uniref:cathepsin D isoform X2 n=1 Tax=Halyomorpha halys TaxID=286706 RepID=UPI0006D522D7|nr:aspartic proteinase A3 isoform X2 [Halyomorpha halys]
MNIVIFGLSIILWFSNSFGLYRVPLYKNDWKDDPLNKEFEGIQKNPVSSEKLSVNLMKHSDDEYYGLVSLGTPQQTFKVLFATGYSYFWIQSEKCHWYRMACWDHKGYDSSKSSTYRENGKTFCIDDFNGKSSGIISEDIAKFGNVIITNQTFGEADKPPNLGSYDGVFGLAFPSKTNTGKPPLSSVISKGLLKKEMFSLFLDKYKQKNTAGQIIFGDWDEEKFYVNSVNYIPLSDNTAWIFDLDYIHTDDGEQLCYSCQALVDTGTALIIGHKDVVRKIHNKIGASTHGTEASVDCSMIDQLPPITFSINNRSYTLKGQDYVVERQHLYFFKRCMIGIVGSERNLDRPWILGNIFLQQFYTIFDIDNKQIAFANLKFF